MPSYRFLLVLALAAFTVTPVMAAEAATQHLKKNEGRVSSHLELVERGTEPLVPRWKLDWKMKTLIGTGLVVNGLYVWALVSDHKANKAAEKQAQQKAAATPPGSAPPSPSSAGNTSPQNYGFPVYPQSETYGNPPTSYSTQQTSTGQSTNPPSANNGPNSRREERPLARKFRRRSPVDIPSELHLKSRIDAVDDGIVTTAGI